MEASRTGTAKLSSAKDLGASAETVFQAWALLGLLRFASWMVETMRRTGAAAGRISWEDP